MDPQSLPESFFQALGVSPAITTNIKGSIRDGRRITDALRLAQSGSEVDESSRQRLLLCAEIAEICGSNLNACQYLLKDQAITNISDIALKYYLPQGQIPRTTEIRHELLYRVPTAVLSAIVDEGILALSPPVRESLSKLLRLAVEEKFDIRSGSLGKFIARPACQEELSTRSTEDAFSVRSLLEALHRLHSLVVDAEDLRYLIGTRFTSARIIAATGQDEFVDRMEERGLPFGKSASIHLEATRINRRNEAFWADIIRTRREVPVLAITGLKPSASAESDSDNANLTTLFKDLDSVTTENSTSVLSPASYLVDLLQMLDQITLELPALRTVSSATTALHVLLTRRPDIASIKLSKADTETPMAYMDLAIEVMEQYLDSILNKNDTPKQDIYAAMSRQLAPMTIFPYNNAIASTREFLQARGYSRYELLRRFQSDHDLVRRACSSSLPSDSGHVAAAQSIHERRLASESLGLQPADFLAITQEGFHTKAFYRLLQGQKPELAAKTYTDAVGLSTAGEYWGYQSDDAQTATWKMLSTDSKTNLRLVKDELLLRSRLTPSQLNTVLKTRYIGNRLVLTLAKGEEFSDKLEDMRLQESLLVKDVEEAGRLSERTCLDLQAFLRLRYRLGWSIETTDAAIAVLARRSQVYDDDDRRHYVLDAGFIERLAAAQQLSTDTGVQLVDLLPFWGPMDAQFPSSLYTRLFLRPGLVSQYPWLSLVNGDALPDATFGHNMTAMLQALRMTQADQQVFMKVLEFDRDTPWTLDNIAQLYSHQQICAILGLSTRRYAEWWQLSQGLANPFLDPQSSLAALGPWLHLPDGVPTVEAALDLLAPVDGQELSAVDLNTMSQIIRGLANVESEYNALLAPGADIEAAQVYSSEALLNLCSRILGPAASKAVVELIEGRSPVDTAIIRLFTQQFGLQESEVLDAYKDPVPSTSPIDQEKVLTSRRQAAIRSMVPELRRRALDDVVSTALAARFQDADSELLQSLLSATSPAISGASGASVTSLQHLKGLLDSLTKWLKTPVTGDTYFFPPASAEYTFVIGMESGSLLVDYQVVSFLDGAPKRSTASQSLRQGRASLLSFTGGLTLQDLAYSTASGEESFSERVVCSVELAREACLLLGHLDRSLKVAKTMDLNAAEVSFHRDRGVVLSNLNLDQLARLQSFVHTRNEYKTSGSSLISYSWYLRRASEAATGVPQDTENEAGDQLVAETYQLTKVAKEDISAFFDMEWPNTSAKDRAKMLLDLSPLKKFAECNEMAKKLAVPFANLYRWAQCPSLPNQLEDFDFVDELQTALSSGNAVNALALAKESLRSKQQQILQEYLLRTPTFQSRGIDSADDLSAEFLIDVQMGPVLQTSRIGQAIASVQLFVQRCLLGLEKVYGIPTTKIDQARWKWMSKYTLWQANRKVFLYPENWLEPSLRDDKTQAFEELENKMLQVNLNKETISQLLREYVYSAHEVADLDVLSYLWEATRGFRGNYHFFARTRNAPFIFYYRRLSVTGASAASVRWNWLPWTKMEVDIQTHEVDLDHTTLSRPGSYLLPALFRNRLFLFMPQITRQTSPATPEAAPRSLYKSSQDETGPKAPSEYWEVKMAWAEMRNNKWSPKYVTATGIDVRPVETKDKDGKVVSTEPIPVSSFRFRLETRNFGQSDQILSVHVDRWKKKAASTKPEDQLPGSFVNLGRFEMQGPRLRLVDRAGGSAVGSLIDAVMEFGRISRDTLASNAQMLREEVKALKVGVNPDSQKSVLAVPDPAALKGAKHQLTWLLTFDDSQFSGTSGLVVERSTPSQIQSFFGFPTITLDGTFDTSLKTTVVTRILTHETSLNMVEEIADKEGYESIFDALEQLPQSMVSLAFGRDGNTYNELASPGSLYNWELGFHAVSLLMERLLATQQFDLALELSRLVFDPSRDDSSPASSSSAATTKPLSRLDRCWRFVPFKWAELRLAGSVRDLIQRLAPGTSTSSEIADWVANPFSPHAVARGRPAVYMKRFVMKCIEILIAGGDQYFRQDSLEAVPLAIQRYTEASELFGPAPIAIDPPTKPVTKSYAEIKTLVNDFATASVDMELEFPYFINPLARKQKAGPQEFRDGTLGFVRSTYFGVPANPQMQALRDLIDDRLYKIRNGLDINGSPRRLPLFDAPLDPGQLVTAFGAGSTLSSFVEGTQGPMPNYRARYLLQKALELCDELRGFGESYLAIKEKRDAEAMSSLRVRQEGGILSLMTEVKQHQIQEATLSVEALEETRKGHVTRLKYYLALVGESNDGVPATNNNWIDLQQDIAEVTKDELRMSPEERLEMRMIDKSRNLNEVATCLEQSAVGLMVLPTIVSQFEPLGVGTSVKADVSLIAKGMVVTAGIIRAGAASSDATASRASRKGLLVSQLQERRMQANAAGRDIKTMDKQIASQKKAIEGSQAELRAHQQQVVDNAETEAYLRTKYTSEKLYSWLDVETRRLAYQTYLAALDMSKTAERALSFEYGPRAQSFLTNAYWDESRDGLLAAEQLTAALHRMDKFYIQNTTHDYELTKTVSLRQVSPLALIDLRTKGVAEFDMPEILFDQDFPGHYCRRIKTVSVSIPSIVGPYIGVNCSLRLLEHRYRLKAGRSSTGSYYLEDASNDERFHSDRIPISSIALSTCNQDSGTFELNFSSDRYVPFEGAGVISKWKLEFPGPYPQFDYRSISDVLFTIQYTALEGGALWKRAATDAVHEFRSQLNKELGSDGAFLFMDLPVDFPNEWRSFCTSIGVSFPGRPATMDLSHIPNLLPFSSPRQTVKVERVFAAIQPAKDGWAEEGELKMLDSVLTEQENSTAQLRLLGPQKVKSSGQGIEEDMATLGQELSQTSLSLSVAPTRFKQKVPQNFWVVIQYTQS